MVYYTGSSSSLIPAKTSSCSTADSSTSVSPERSSKSIATMDEQPAPPHLFFKQQPVQQRKFSLARSASMPRRFLRSLSFKKSKKRDSDSSSSSNDSIPESIEVQHPRNTTRDILNSALNAVQEVQNDDSKHFDISEEITMKSVRFDTDNIITHPAGYSMSDVDKRDLFWTPGERLAIMNQIWEEVSDFRLEGTHQDDLWNAMALCEECKREKMSHEEQQQALKFLQRLAKDLRGLETFLEPILKSNRTQHSKYVLEYAKKIPKTLQIDMRARMLSAKSRQSSRHFRLLAQTLGEVDELSSQQ